MKSFLKTFAAALVLGALALMAEPNLNQNSALSANDWQFYLGSLGDYCEGCCAEQSFCCGLPYPCREGET